MRSGDGFNAQFATLEELYENPELMRPPVAVLPRLAWRGHATMLAAPDKAGKSTLAAHAVRALVRGERFLDEPVVAETGRVLWAGLEEHVSHAVRRFKDLSVPGGVDVLTKQGSDLLEAMDYQLTGRRYDLVLLDSLQEYGRISRGEAPSDGDNGAWGSVVRPMVQLGRDHDVPILILHHVRRSDGKARGASESFAAVDVLLEMRHGGGADRRVRRIEGRGRWQIDPFEIALRHGRFELHDGRDPDIEKLIVSFVEQSPGCTRTAVCDAISKKKQVVIQLIDDLVGRGHLTETVGPRNAKCLSVAKPAPPRPRRPS